MIQAEEKLVLFSVFLNTLLCINRLLIVTKCAGFSWPCDSLPVCDQAWENQSNVHIDKFRETQIWNVYSMLHTVTSVFDSSHIGVALKACIAIIYVYT